MNGAIKVEIDGNVIGLKFAYPAIRMFLDEMAAKSKFYYSHSGGDDFYLQSRGGLKQTSLPPTPSFRCPLPGCHIRT